MARKGKSKARPASESLRHLISDCVISLLLVSALIIFEPFHIVKLYNGAFDNLSANLAASDYPSDRTPNVTVVLAGDDLVTDWNTSWPLEYELHAEIIEQIAQRHPKAIVVDFLFFDQRTSDPTMPALVDALKRAADQAPVLIAVAPFLPTERTVIRDELRDLAEAHPNFHLVSVGASVDGDLDYGLSELYGYPNAASLLASLEGVKVTAELEAIRLYWPSPRCTTPPLAGPSVCSKVSDNSVSRAVRLLAGSVTNGAAETWGLAEPWLMPGHPFSTVDAGDLMSDPDTLGDLSGNIVFYGGDFSFLSDSIYSPVYGTMPGVFAHAVAFHNLAALGDRVWRTAPPFGQSQKVHLLALTVLGYLGGMAALALQWQATRARWRLPLPAWIDPYAFSLGFVTVILVIGFCESALMGAPLGYWLSAVGILALRKLDKPVRLLILTWLGYKARNKAP